MRHFLGLDAGGTKTFCLVADETGTVKGFGRAGTGNYEVVGVNAAAEENRKAVECALHEAGLSLRDITAIGMGIAGADLPEDYAMLEQQIYTPLFGAIPRAFRNDSMGALRGGTRDPFGVVIACGTGCVCAGRNRAGEQTRVGGLGDEFGDECTGKGIGRTALRRIWQARDGIIPPTRLTDLFVARAGLTDLDALFHALYRRELTEDALEPMAPLVFEAALEGDEAACAILTAGGRYLGAMVNAAIRRLHMQNECFEVVMAGSVFRGESPLLADAMREEIRRVAPNARTVMPRFEPVVGTLLMAIEMTQEMTEAMYESLSRSLDEAQDRYSVRFKAE